MNWTQSYKDLSAIYIKEFESRWSDGVEVASAISRYVKHEFENAQRVLDLPCGIGRISIPLSLQGFDVLGIDFSRQYINFANMKKRELKSNKVNFLVKDMYKSSDIISNFDPQVIISWWTSIGYRNRMTDVNFFKKIRSSVEPGTIFIIETWYREYILNFPIKHFWNDLDDVMVLVDQSIDPLKETVSTVHRYYEKKDGNLQFLGLFTSEIMLYSLIDLKNMLEDSGWEVINLMNSLSNKSSFDIKKDRAVFVTKSI